MSTSRTLKSALLATFLLPGMVHAGGLYMYEIGTSDLGFAAAGTAARAEDASTLYANPAGMTRLAGDQFTIGAQALYGDLDYSLDSDSLLRGSDPGNVVGWMPGGSGFYSHSISDDLKIGIGAYGNFGLAMDFGNSWAANNAPTNLKGANLVDETALMAFTLQPTLAYRFNDQWSLGVGLTANYGFLKLERQQVIGSDKVNQVDHDWAYGGRLGVMYEASKHTRLGLVWGSEVEYNFDVDGSVTGILGRTHTIPIAADVKAPQQVMTSLYHRIDDDWAVMGNLGWQDWSRFADTTLEVNGTTTTSSLELRDTWHAALGAQYTLRTDTKLNFGVSYDSSFYESQSNTSFAMPGGAAWRYGAGLQYTLSDHSELGIAAEYLNSENARDNSQLVKGEYEDPAMYFMSVHYSRRF